MTISLMQRFEHLNWRSLDDIMDWIYDVRQAADEGALSLDVAKVLKEFDAHELSGHVDFDEDSKENFAKHIVNIALSGLRSQGVPDEIVFFFIDTWRREYGRITWWGRLKRWIHRQAGVL